MPEMRNWKLINFGLNYAYVDRFVKSFKFMRACVLQAAIIRNTVDSSDQCRQPLFLKILLDQAVTWTSYHNVSEQSLPTSIHAAITRLFESVEVKFGQKFISHALGYLTCSTSGLSALEMEDVLSCDDEVGIILFEAVSWKISL